MKLNLIRKTNQVRLFDKRSKETYKSLFLYYFIHNKKFYFFIFVAWIKFLTSQSQKFNPATWLQFN